jgi:hypothetical protein
LDFNLLVLWAFFFIAAASAASLLRLASASSSAITIAGRRIYKPAELEEKRSCRA